ncbi:Pleckstrin homology domain-containing family M member 1 [Schistosoma japonicum]|nr:Pleckstrin homology domain-containing family M member 1 [Schistosoma japonicum]KAH8866278.1 Pleckstrin homology domain-containing family M member 1 [Schistosoma japonicum]
MKRQKSHKEVFSHIRRVRSHHQFGQIDSAPLATAMRICYVTGKYYCERCHWDDKWYVPGSIFLLNDTSKQPVCRSVYIKLRVIWDSLVMKIPAYWHQDNLEAEQVYEVRNKLHPLLRYALLCPEASSIKASIESGILVVGCSFSQESSITIFLHILGGKYLISVITEDIFQYRDWTKRCT